MADLPTLEAAMKLADQDCPLPSLAGPALKVLREALRCSLAEERTRPMETVECGGCAPAVMAVPPAVLRHIDSAPVDGTPVLVKVRAAEFLPGRAASWAGLYFVARNRGDASEWCYAGPVGCGGFIDAWLEGWVPLPGTECWCSTCRPITLTDMRMVLCPTCGNKRCPHAHDHRNACTGSNDVGQPGSSWEHVKPITPAEDC